MGDTLEFKRKPLPEEVPIARSIGQIIEMHLEEIVGPEVARRVREYQKKAPKD